MSEQLILKNIPSGYESSTGLQERAVIDNETLPWLDEPYELSITKCELASGDNFLVASAVGTSPKLIEAANAMTDGQSQNANNMFYSRIPTVVAIGHSPNVETMPTPSTDFPVFVMRNKGGQRVYFARISLGLPEEQTYGPTIVKLAVCDKNRQDKVMSVLSGMGHRQMYRKLSK